MKDLLDTLLETGANINANGKWHTPLTALCEHGAYIIVKYLLQQGADPNILCGISNTPLTSACRSGCPNTVNEILQAGADINPENALFKPLIVACKYGYTSIVETLLNVGCNVNMQHRQSTPLSVACQNGHVNVVEYLLREGAEVNLPAYWTPCFSLSTTPLIEASSEGNLKVVQTLLKWGAKVNEDHVLSAAAEGCHLNVIKELLEAGLDIDTEDGHRALQVACSNGHVDLIKELLSRFSGITCNNKCNELLIHACKVGHLNLVKELLAAGADCNAQDDYTSPLVAACKYGDLEVVRELIKFGADVNLNNLNSVDHSAPLTVTCESGHVELLQELIVWSRREFEGQCLNVNQNIQIYADCKSEEDLECKPLLYRIIYSSAYEMVQKVELLLDAEADVNIRVRQTMDVMAFNTEDCNPIRQVDVKADDKDDIITESNKTWVLNTSSESYHTVSEDGCEFLNQKLSLGFNVNQYVQICFDDDHDAQYADDDAGDDDDDDFYICVKPLLFTLISIYSVEVSEKVRLLLDAGANVNIRLPQTKDTIAFNSEDCHPVLDRYGISLLEMTRRTKLTGNRLPPSACVDRETVARDYNDVVSIKEAY
ncbi:ankyrin repeat domain-containing protein 17-like [Saccostrea cucullata]|uniref:ankyrin repeat domain-containing protein 17-like n=1 Tax=Saccostrea cuccullata TaxID=36930 RepID=UPI002ED37515